MVANSKAWGDKERKNQRHDFEGFHLGIYGDGVIINIKRGSRKTELLKKSVGKVSRVFVRNEFEGV